MNKKILLLGYYGFGNAGDELILLSLLNEIKHITPETRITVLSNNPHKTSRDYGVRAVNRRNPLALVKEIWATDVVVLGGGGLLQDTTSTSLWRYLTRHRQRQVLPSQQHILRSRPATDRAGS